MKINTLMAISPLDGRYRNKVEQLAPYFSEFGLIHYRVRVEIEYLIELHTLDIHPLTKLNNQTIEKLRQIYRNFDETAAHEVKQIEATTNHDVKAVEYYIKDQIDLIEDKALTKNKEFVHFALTSQDINNTATPMLLKDAIQKVYLPRLNSVIEKLDAYALVWKDIPLLARTHGQAASPTTMGKEMAVFANRLKNQRDELVKIPYPAKFGGATGNLNAHYIAYPKVDWENFANKFVNENLKLSRSYPTTQIEHYDGLSRIFDCLKRINTIVIDLCQDVWLYISQDYFKQKLKAGEIGSSTMPHKVNPIDFENAEGNCGLSTAMLEFLSRKLPVSRLQRDLTDSTILRNLGVGIGYAFLAQASLQRGLGKLLLNPNAIQIDLDNNWAILAEAIQTILRREAYPNAYEALKELTRGKDGINEQSLKNFVNGLDVSDEVKQELLVLRPETYLGNAGEVL